MKVSLAIFSVVLLHIVRFSEGHHEVPELEFEVFSPKGLKISMPDSRNFHEVEFSIKVPREPETMITNVKYPERGYWVYWNPNVVVHLYEKIDYKVTVKSQEGSAWKSGVHVVKKVEPLSGRVFDDDCDETEGQKIIAEFPRYGEFNNHAGKKISETSSSFKSYSTHEESNRKPITKSSKTTTSGTFYVKPSGVVEASGYKSESTFDSTKNEGEQWKHYRSELTPEELEKLRQTYGAGFNGFHDLSKTLTGMKSYEKFYESDIKNFPPAIHSVGVQENAGATHQFHETHESSSHVKSRPVLRYEFKDSSSGNPENVDSGDLNRPLPNPLSFQGSAFKKTEYVRQEHVTSDDESARRQPNFSSFSADSSPKKISQTFHSQESYNRHHEETRPGYGSRDRTTQREFESGNLRGVENKHDYRTHSYNGNVFDSITSTKPKVPQDCVLTPNSDYVPSGSIRELEKFSYELSCLSSLAETSTKKEIDSLKEKNFELFRRLEILEHEMKRLNSTCTCH